MSALIGNTEWEAIATFFSLSETDITSTKAQEGIYSLEVLANPTVNLSSCQTLLQERVSSLKSCFHCDVMAVQGSQYFSSHDFELALSEQLPPLDIPDSISNPASQQASDIFFMRLHQTNEQYLHFIDALEEYTLELDEDSVLAQRDLQRLETKLDLVMQLLADKNTLTEPANTDDLLFSYTLTPQHFSLQLPLINSSIGAECIHLLLTRLNTLLLGGSGERIKNTNSLQGFHREIESNKGNLEQVFVFSLNLHPLLNQSFYLAVRFNRVVIDSVSKKIMLEADIVEMSEVSREALEKYIFRLHRRQLALQRQKR